MIDADALFEDLTAIAPIDWRETLLSLLNERLADAVHGHLGDWQAVLRSLPGVANDPCALREQLLRLSPWRKGPFDVAGVHIDAEWRSDLKWSRVAPAIGSLDGRNVLDVGCGNGYYAIRMLDAGADRVIGIDPSLLFVAQFAAIRALTGLRGAHVLPLRLEDLPRDTRAFDTTFSMGVLYHRREPGAHLEDLRGTLRPGGQLVLETLILPGGGAEVLVPEKRYARMRNVWHLPTLTTLCGWLDEAGFSDTQVVDVTRTTTAEQRTTAWMTFESLRESLDPDDPTLTIEGLPAPTRAILLCRAP